MPAPDKFTPIADTSNSVLLPGVQTDALIGAQIVPPDLKPIMASGDMTATLFPLADPLPPMAPVMPVEVAQVALPEDAFAQGLPQLEQPVPQPPEFPELPPPVGAAQPGIQPLAEPLPTTVALSQRPWPPTLEGYQAPGFPLPALMPLGLPELPLPSTPAPMPFGLPEPPLLPMPTPAAMTPAQIPSGILEAILPQLTAQGTVLAAAPEPVPSPFITPVGGIDVSAMTTYLDAVRPDLSLTQVPAGGAPALSIPADIDVLAPSTPPASEPFPNPLIAAAAPLPAPGLGEPVSAAVRSGLDALAEVLTGRKDREDDVKRFADERGRLRAPQPSFADGKVLWKQVWGADE